MILFLSVVCLWLVFGGVAAEVTFQDVSVNSPTNDHTDEHVYISSANRMTH